MMKTKGKVLMAMSGGLDSTVSALLLMEQGYELVGATFRNYDLQSHCGDDAVPSAILEAQENAQRMGIEHHVLDFREVFRERVIDNFIKEYLAGRTPNPCVVCNYYIKWGQLWEAAKQFGCDYIATGHYAKIEEFEGHHYLRHASDKAKDQTYFLWQVPEEMLARTLFPLANLTKTRVREIAAEHGYEALSKKSESQEICFIPDDDYRRFLAENVQNYSGICRPGDYVDVDGKVVGQHQGFVNYTIGQRKGLRIALGEPMYVCNINAESNRVMLGRREALYTSSLEASNYHFTDEAFVRTHPEVMAQIRYRSAPTTARVEFAEGRIVVRFDEPVWGVTPGQSVVFFQDGRLVGGGFID